MQNKRSACAVSGTVRQSELNEQTQHRLLNTIDGSSSRHLPCAIARQSSRHLPQLPGFKPCPPARHYFRHLRVFRASAASRLLSCAAAFLSMASASRSRNHIQCNSSISASAALFKIPELRHFRKSCANFASTMALTGSSSAPAATCQMHASGSSVFGSPFCLLFCMFALRLLLESGQLCFSCIVQLRPLRGNVLC
jgi:hypothetical protein